MADELYADLRRRQRAIEARIAGYKAKLVACERELEGCLDMLQRRHDFVYPILTLPTEITSEIFVHCLLPDYWNYSTPNPLYAPMLLLHVCRAWRSIAISTPRLWVDLRLDLEHLPPSFFEAENFEKFLADCVARAGACPLSFELSGSLKREEDERRVIATSLDRLSTHIVQLTTDIQHYPEHPIRFPLLQKLTLCFPDEDDDPVGFQGPSIQTFSATPQLRELELYGKAAPSLVAIPWETVAVFHGQRLASRAYTEVLQLAPSLVKAVFDETSLDPEIPTTSHPNLKSLKIRHAGSNLVRSLTFPALEDLDIFAYDVEDLHLVQFLSRSSSSLLKFRTPEIPLQYLHGMSILTHLQLARSEQHWQYLYHLFYMLHRAKYPDFLPRLQALQFTTTIPFVNPPLVAALFSRSAAAENGAAKLASFRQIWSHSAFNVVQLNYERNVALALEELVQNGMEIYIGPSERSVKQSTSKY